MIRSLDFARLVQSFRSQLEKPRKKQQQRPATIDVAILEDRVLFSATPFDAAAQDFDQLVEAAESFTVAEAGLPGGDLFNESLNGPLPFDQAGDLAELLQGFKLLGQLDYGEGLLILDQIPHDGHIDPFGNEYHALTALPILEGDSAQATAPDAEAAPFPTTDTFLLHSNPGASHTIYLDFDGHVTSGTYWNDSFNGGQDIVTPAYDFDGDASFFSDAELERVQFIWQRVSEDFIPFDVDVTTEAPDLEALTKNGGSDTDWGVRLVIGGSSYDWYGAGAGGVAYVGSFNWSSDTPAFVFEEQLGNGNEKYVAEATSHEIGHTLGLGHDGSSSSSYYSGHGSGDTGWAPIMGTGYYKNLTQWSRGEYPGANNTQDDLAIITSNNGFGYRQDDHGDSNDLASLLDFSGDAVSGSGIIERTSDVDVFSFSTDGGTVSLQINPFERGPNLDILAELYDTASNLIVAANPFDLLTASLNATLTAGQYFLHVTGVGHGDPAADGYSDYGSLGRYAIDGTVTPSSSDSVSLAAAPASQVEGHSGTTSLTFTVTRTGDLSDATSVDYSVAGSGLDPAEASDFSGGLLPTGTLLFNPGEISKIISIGIAGDQQIEADETFTVTLANPGGDTQIANSQAVGTILNDDTLDTSDAVSVSATDASRTEGDSGPKAFTFTVTRTGFTGDATSVDYFVSGSGNGPANAADFVGGTLPSGTVIFAGGETSKTITIDVAGDTVVEGHEEFTVTLNNAAGDTQIAVGQATGTILNDDVAPPTAGITVTPVSGLMTTENAGAASFTVVLDSQPGADVIVHLESLDTTEGTVDVGVLTFTAANWNVAQTVTVHGVDDAERDGNVGYTVRLAAAESADQHYNGLNPDDVQLTNQDNDKGGKAGGGGGGGGGKGGPKRGALPMLEPLVEVSDEVSDAAGDSSESFASEGALQRLARELAHGETEGKVAALEFARGQQGDLAGAISQEVRAWPTFSGLSHPAAPGRLAAALRTLYGDDQPADSETIE